MAVVEEIAYVRYRVPDLDVMQLFLEDFGLILVRRSDAALYMRAHRAGAPCHISECGGSQEQPGIGLIARTRADLDELAERFGVTIRANDELGSGAIVSLRDPAGIRIDVLHGFDPLPALPSREPTRPNPAVDRQRFGGGVRVAQGPSQVSRLGHVVLKVPDVNAAIVFYGSAFNFKVADSYYAEDSATIVAAFLRCGLGDQHTDHHTVALVASPDQTGGIDHSAFEVIDMDDLAVGSEHLRRANYQHAWGIGRHIEGSQIFDYWRDPFGNKIEHWTDGDLINDSYQSTHQRLRPDGLAQWGPPLTPDFFA